MLQSLFWIWASLGITVLQWSAYKDLILHHGPQYYWAWCEQCLKKKKGSKMPIHIEGGRTRRMDTEIGLRKYKK